MIDYDRFQSESLLNCFRAEAAALREVTPDVPITTNLMGSFKTLDYHKWAQEMDIVSWDSYPGKDAPPADMAFQHDLMRGLKEGQPFLLMEQTPSQQNWQAHNALKRPGIMRLWSYQAMAHGSGFNHVFPVAARARGDREVPRRGGRAYRDQPAARLPGSRRAGPGAGKTRHADTWRARPGPRRRAVRLGELVGR